jgi:uncharacterized protein
MSSQQQQPSPISATAFLGIIKNRRSYYPLSKDLTISKDRIQEIVKQSLMHVPSSFNSQTNRVIVLFGAEHDRLWDITAEVLKAMVPEERWKPTGDKMSMFKGAAGTVRSPRCSLTSPTPLSFEISKFVLPAYPR